MAEIIIPDGVRYHLYAASEGQTAFAYTFPILASADLGVKRLRAGVSTRLTLDTDYTVSGAGTQPGGTVTLTAESQAGDLVALFGDETGERITDFLGETFTGPEINAELDRIAQAVLDLRRTVNRRIGIDETDDGSVGLTLPRATDRANKVLGFSSSGAPEARSSTGTEIFVLADAGPPSAGLGVAGDLALGTDGSLWSKASGSWAATAINLKGPTGAAGSVGSLPDGTPAAPGIAFAADTNTGYHRPAADTLAEVVGGVIKVQTTTTGVEVLGNNAGVVLPEHASAMAQPAAGKMAIYGKTNGRIYAKDSAGRERCLVDIDPSVCDFRLSLVSNTPVMTTNVAAATQLYLTPFNGNRIAIYDPAEAVWDVITSPQNVVSIGALLANTVYDVFAINNGGVVASLEFVAWTSATVRATAIVFQDGVPCKSGDLSRRLVGTIRTGAAAGTMDWNFGGTGLGGVAANLPIWHANPKVRVPVSGIVRDSTDSWTYAVTAWRGVNNSANMRINLLDGDGTMQARAIHAGLGQPPASNFGGIGIGLDSTTTAAAAATAGPTGVNGIQLGGSAFFSGAPGLGWHYLQALEARFQGTGSITFYGDNGIVYFQNGLAYEVMI